MTAIVTMNVKIGTVEGLMNICIPYSCVESVIDKLNTKYWYSTMQEQGWRTVMRKRLKALLVVPRYRFSAVVRKEHHICK